MATWIWIVIAIVVVLAVGLGTGLTLARRRRITLIEPAGKPEVGPAPPKAGTYKAGSSISFSAGSGTAVAPKPKAAEPRVVEPKRAEPTPAEPTPAEPAPVVEPPATPSLPERTEVDGQPGVGDDAAVPRDSVRPDVVDVPLPDEDVPTAVPILLEELPVEPAVAEEPQIEELSAPPALDQIAPTEGRLGRLRGRLSRSQNAFGRSLLGLLGAGTLDEDSWTDVEDTLLMADLGAGAAAEITQKLRTEVARQGVTDSVSARALLRRVLIEAVETDAQGNIPDRTVKALPHDGRPSVLLVVGVNGTGKTTTTGKLARVLVADGRSVVLGAADTFRAAAADQLQTWGERAGATVVRAEAGADPASVAFDAVRRGITDGADAVLIDTAGRLHTKTGLMDELGKVKRVIEKQAVVDEILLVLDATTGQNGLVQARVFAEVVDVTGIVLTKLDGTAKGGIVVAVQRALGVPVKLVGLGEGPDDLAPFEPAAFVDALLGD
ncbi:fused signal recognition particle receptor [Nakamurella panacisegetis]|uniref:Signal recognition particle receptor FtsY n=1 Tax=Nakamurella panacisegetis TaxID=1090615 RepID=A0A1H0R5D3_9ACTN|nr:signal recognition particle-docking protein FtsY [Nakamurella panacisegetis]SDP24714.1 fused signal recognition particle receptor [Nakamurella panacisegetis]